MIRLIGSILLAGGAAFWGFYAAAQLRRRIHILDEISSGLRLLEQELEWSAPELCTLAGRLQRQSRGSAKILFAAFETRLMQGGQASVCRCWEESVESVRDVPREARWCLSSLGDVLGRFDVQEQRASVKSVRQRLERLRQELEQQYRVQGRTCQTIGLSGGAFLVILLL